MQSPQSYGLRTFDMKIKFKNERMAVDICRKLWYPFEGSKLNDWSGTYGTDQLVRLY